MQLRTIDDGGAFFCRASGSIGSAPVGGRFTHFSVMDWRASDCGNFVHRDSAIYDGCFVYRIIVDDGRVIIDFRYLGRRQAVVMQIPLVEIMESNESEVIRS
jgi:hypothetical protein